MQKLNWYFEPYDPMLRTDSDGISYCLQQSQAGIEAIITRINMDEIRFKGNLYECLEFYENYKRNINLELPKTLTTTESIHFHGHTSTWRKEK